MPQEDQFYSQALTATGGIGPYLWTVQSGQIPSGLTLGATTGVLSGYISSPGTYTFTVQLVDAAPTSPQSTTRTFTIVVGPPIVTTTSLPNAFVNTPYSQQLTVGGTTSRGDVDAEHEQQPASELAVALERRRAERHAAEGRDHAAPSR